MIFICTGLISIKSLFQNSNSLNAAEAGDIAIWIPCVFTVITPMLYTLSSVFIKHLTSEKVGFDALSL